MSVSPTPARRGLRVWMVSTAIPAFVKMGSLDRNAKLISTIVRYGAFSFIHLRYKLI